ncbi:hypothetical protein LJC38_02855 [Parabacteroides sp. OttesenSCG-928-K15]|nr:hypothetical protein [Parabacteroides sp. OttesenSCG-928-K15]
MKIGNYLNQESKLYRIGTPHREGRRSKSAFGHDQYQPQVTVGNPGEQKHHKQSPSGTIYQSSDKYNKSPPMGLP